MPATKSNAKSKKIGSDDKEPDSPKARRARLPRASKAVEDNAVAPAKVANKRTANKKVDLDDDDIDDPKDKASKNSKVKQSKVRDGDYDLSNDFDEGEYFNVAKPAKNVAKSKKMPEKEADDSSEDDVMDGVQDDLPKTLTGRKTGPRKQATAKAASQDKDMAEEEEPLKEDNDEDVKATNGKKPSLKAARGGRALAKKSAKMSVQVKVGSQDDGDEDNNTEVKTVKGRKPPTRKTTRPAAAASKDLDSKEDDIPLKIAKSTKAATQGDSEKSADEDGDIVPKVKRGRKAPAKKATKNAVTEKGDVPSPDEDSGDDVAVVKRNRKAPVKKSLKKNAIKKVLSDHDTDDESAAVNDGIKSQDSNDEAEDKQLAAVGPKVSRTGKTTKSKDSNNDVEDEPDDTDKVAVKNSKGSKTGKTAKVSANNGKATKDSKASSDDDEDSQDVPAADVKVKKPAKEKKPAAKKATNKNAAKSSGKAKDDDEEEVQMKTIVIKGEAPVDPECFEKVNSSHVYCENNDVYDAMLNQTMVQNNNNKFYLMQILEDDATQMYSVWFRWGRVGARGQTQLTDCHADLNKAKKLFEQKFKDKTKNVWSERDVFEKVSGKYDLLAIDYSAKDDVEVAKTKVEEVEKPESKLDLKLQSFIELIFNIKAMEASVLEMKYDAKKSPLGKLTTEQVTAGYAALKMIEDCILNHKPRKDLMDACNVFYTRIPHVFGMKRPPLIETAEDLSTKIELLKMLGDIQVAMTILNEKVNLNHNPIDSHYESLKCTLVPVPKTDDIFEMVNDYLQNTHASTHRTYNMELVDLFDCCRPLEESNFKDVGNKMLLWHGSRLTNAVGILKQGLRIAPPEAPSTGYMFGKGVYFADMSSKSANYCYTSSSQNEGILYLCEVAVGTPNKLLSANYDANKLPNGCHSVLGQGSVKPNPDTFKTLPNGTLVPLGKGIDSGVKNPAGYTLNYNEYIVYDVNQIKLKYVLRVKFLYKY